jgi:hypothetical protein
MGEYVFCRVAVRVPDGTRAEALDEFMSYQWTDYFDVESLPDGSIVHSGGDTFNYGSAGVKESFKLDELAAAGCDWTIHDDGGPDWGPTLSACIDGLQFELSSGRSDQVDMPARTAWQASDAELLADLRLQAARHWLVSDRFGTAPARSELATAQQHWIELVVDPPGSDADDLARDPLTATALVANPATRAHTLALAAKVVDLPVALELAVHPNASGRVLEQLISRFPAAEYPGLARMVAGHPHATARALARCLKATPPRHYSVWPTVIVHPRCTHKVASKLPARDVAEHRPSLLLPKGSSGEARRCAVRLAADFDGSCAELAATVERILDQPSR